MVDRSDRGDVALIRGTDYDIAAQMRRIGLPSRGDDIRDDLGYELR
jgi:hypothetical protein